MIKIKKSDSIIDIITKINNSNDKNIILNFPFWHPVLHNYLSLKILKSKTKNKELIIVTNDLTSKRIWKSLWIKYSIIKDNSFIKDENILKHNFSFWEYFKFIFKKYLEEIKDFISFNKKINSLKKYSKENYSQKSWIWFFITALSLSIIIFLFIFYFAVNKSYIYITPEIEVKTNSINLIFREQKENDSINSSKVINIKKIEKLVQTQELFSTSWVKEDEVKKSKWKVWLLNETNETIKLLQNSRLSTESGEIFIIDAAVNIPSSTLSSSGEILAWKIEVDVEARLKDESWKIIWKRWNIKKDTSLFFPWLVEFKDSIYWIAADDFSWWEDSKNTILTKEDVENAKIILEEKLKKQSLDLVKNEIDKSNKNNNVTYDILNLEDSIRYSWIDINTIWEVNIWDQIDNFQLSWSIQIEVYTYNKDAVIAKLREKIEDLTLEDVEKVLLINDKSLRFSNIIYKVKNPYEVKSTLEIEVFLVHNFLNNNDAYVQKLKWSILWKDDTEAKKILLNNPKISNVEIENRPFFIKKISNIQENIIFKIVEN